MPSLRHAALAAYMRYVIRRSPFTDDSSHAEAIRARRSTENPQPPESLRDRISVDDSPGFEVFTLAPSRPASAMTVLYVHGGSYVADLVPQNWEFVAELSEGTGATVVVPRYPLAPEATWRTSRAALVDLASRDPQHLVLMGDSAGGGLAIVLAQHLVAAGTPPAGLVAIAPWVDLPIDLEFGEVTNDPWLDLETSRSTGRLWAGDDDLRHPDLSPLFGELRGLPPTLLISGSRDILHPANVEMVKRMRAAEVPVTFIEGKRLVHSYPLLPIPEARSARRAIVDFANAVAETA